MNVMFVGFLLISFAGLLTLFIAGYSSQSGSCMTPTTISQVLSASNKQSYEPRKTKVPFRELPADFASDSVVVIVCYLQCSFAEHLFSNYVGYNDIIGNFRSLYLPSTHSSLWSQVLKWMPIFLEETLFRRFGKPPFHLNTRVLLEPLFVAQKYRPTALRPNYIVFIRWS